MYPRGADDGLWAQDGTQIVMKDWVVDALHIGSAIRLSLGLS